MRWFILIVLIFPAYLFGQDSIQHNWTLNGYVNDMPSLMKQGGSGDVIFDNTLHNRLNFKWYNNSNTLGVALEVRSRLITGETAKLTPGYAKIINSDNGFVKLSANLLSGNSYVLNTKIDRAYLDYTRNKFQLRIGRQRINWGQTYVWNPNDIFNTYNYLDFDYIEKPGSDAIRGQFYTSETGKAELVVKADSSGKPTVAGLYLFNRWNYDIQFISGITNDDVVIGSGWSGQLAKGGFRGEASYFMPKKDFLQQNGTLTASVGWDYMFKNSLFLQFECLYNGNKPDSAGVNIFDNNAFKISAKNPFLNGFSYFASVSYPVTPLINSSLATILNPDNKVYILVPSIDYNVLQNLDLSLLAQLMGVKAQPGNLTTVSIWFFRVKYSF